MCNIKNIEYLSLTFIFYGPCLCGLWSRGRCTDWSTCWTDRSSNPERDRFSHLQTHPELLWAEPCPFLSGYGGFLGGDKAAGAWRWPLTPSSTEVEIEWSYSSTSSLCLRGLYATSVFNILWSSFWAPSTRVRSLLGVKKYIEFESIPWANGFGIH
jgi:hypothetical protein